MGHVVIRGQTARDQVFKMLKDGSSLDEAAQATGFSRDYVRQLGVRVGIRFPRGKYKTNKSDRIKKIVALYKAGNSPTEIADHLDKSISTVYLALKEGGTPAGAQRKRKKEKIVKNEFRVCKECGAVFYCAEWSNQIFCCKPCEKENNRRRNDPVRRARKYKATIDGDITLESVVEKEKGVCYLCGGKIDWSDYKIVNGKKCACGRYPTIEHVVALCNGGAHSWENIRLAHFRCNASKGVGAVG